MNKFDLGMTFVNVNNRAYVGAIAPNSDAAAAGIQPRDSLQVAVVLAGDGLESLQGDEQYAQTYALECEKKGKRTSFEELKSMLQNCTIPFKSSVYNRDDKSLNNNIITNNNGGKNKDSNRTLSHNIQMFESAPDGQTQPQPQSTKTSFSSRLRWTTHNMVSRCNPTDLSSINQDLSPSTENGEAKYPIIFVFRRTRKRHLGDISHIGLPSFRLDDECERAALLIQRLAPSIEGEPHPDAWDEIAHDAREYLSRHNSKLSPSKDGGGSANNDNNIDLEFHLDGKGAISSESGDNCIPLDSMEQHSKTKLSHVKSQMAMRNTQRTSGGGDDVEAATIRGMIQQAKGVAFVRTSKMVLGFSVHFGSGIVVSRLDDGTWSAPAAIGLYGGGLGVQFGLEVADYIFILQTDAALEHFCRGDNFTLGGNVGAAVAGVGREAYGAASYNGRFCNSTNHTEYDEKNSEELADLAPIVAYGKSQGLYFGVSLEGSKIFTRDKINQRTYKFTTGREVTGNDILTGKVPTPPEAEDLYAALHSVELTHEISNLPLPPEILINDLDNEWRFDRLTFSDNTNDNKHKNKPSNLLNYISNLPDDEAEEFTNFETKFKNFLYGGVAVQRIVLDSDNKKEVSRQKRTLWLMLPETGALRIGFVSKLSDVKRRIRQDDQSVSDHGTMASEDGTYDDSTLGGNTFDKSLYTQDRSVSQRHGKVQLSRKHSIVLTDIVVLSRHSDFPINLNRSSHTEDMRMISIKDINGSTLFFLANNVDEAELLVCGLKLLIERETTRLNIRGGIPMSQLGRIAPDKIRGDPSDDTKNILNFASSSREASSTFDTGGYISSENEQEEDSVKEDSSIRTERSMVPECRKSWSQVPARNHLRSEASKRENVDTQPANSVLGSPASADGNQNPFPQYVHGQKLYRDIERDINLHLPLPLIRAILLDSSSPVVKRWELGRGDTNYSKSKWEFPPSSSYVHRQNTPEQQLIAGGPMTGGYRTTTFDRLRNGQRISLSETQTIDIDNKDKLALTISEQMPRRGFSIRVHIDIDAADVQGCVATVTGEITPIGKNMSNQGAVHNAFVLVVDELRGRYGRDGKGLMAELLQMRDNFPSPMKKPQVVVMNNRSKRDVSPISPSSDIHSHVLRERHQGNVLSPKVSAQESLQGINMKSNNLVSFEDVLEQRMNTQQDKTKDEKTSKQKADERPERPSTPSIYEKISHQIDRTPTQAAFTTSTFEDFPGNDGIEAPATIEVKPLPKIRLDLMPAPREEDEFSESSPSLKKKKSRRSKRKDRKKKK